MQDFGSSQPRHFALFSRVSSAEFVRDGLDGAFFNVAIRDFCVAKNHGEEVFKGKNDETDANLASFLTGTLICLSLRLFF